MSSWEGQREIAWHGDRALDWGKAALGGDMMLDEPLNSSEGSVLLSIMRGFF